MLPERFTLGNSLEGTSSLIKSIRPPPCSSLSSLYVGVNPSKINWLKGNVSSNFVSDFSRISILLPITYFSISNFYRIELIFKWAIMTHFGFFLRILLNTSFFSVSSEETSFTRFMADWSDFSVFLTLVKGLAQVWLNCNEEYK